MHFVYQLQTLSTSATVGERIRYYRNKKGLRIVDLAARAGISRDALMGYEADETDPPLECVIKLADILNIMPDWYRPRKVQKKRPCNVREFGRVMS